MPVITNEWSLLMLIGSLVGIIFSLHQDSSIKHKQNERNIEKHEQKVDTLTKQHREAINRIDSIGSDSLSDYFSREMLRPNSYERPEYNNNK